MDIIYAGYLIPADKRPREIEDLNKYLYAISESKELLEKHLNNLNYLYFTNDSKARVVYINISEFFIKSEEDIKKIPVGLIMNGRVRYSFDDTIVLDTLSTTGQIYDKKEVTNTLEFNFYPGFGNNIISFDGNIGTIENESAKDFYERKIKLIEDQFALIKEQNPMKKYLRKKFKEFFEKGKWK